MSRKDPSPERKRVPIFAALAIILVIIGVLLGDPSLLANIVIITVFIVIGPIFFYRYTHFLWIKSIEEQFPNFIRDLADSIRSGMSFPESIKIASRANYGKLSGEVERLHNRMTWGVDFLRGLEIFSKKLKDSKPISEALQIIRESYNSGGNTASTLESVSRDLTLIKEVESERRSLLRQNVLVMYGVFFIFFGIAIMIIFVMVPMINTQPAIGSEDVGLSFDNPCSSIDVFPCNLFEFTGWLFEIPSGITLYYISIFFYIVLIQGLFTGLIIGQLSENSVIAGTKHSMIMVVTCLGVFLFLAKAGLIPI